MVFNRRVPSFNSKKLNIVKLTGKNPLQAFSQQIYSDNYPGYRHKCLPGLLFKTTMR